MISGAEPKQTRKKYKLAEGWDILPLSLCLTFSFFLIQLLNILNIITSFGFLSSFLCVYMNFYMCVLQCEYKYLECQRFITSIYLDWFPPYIMREGLCLNPENADPINLASHLGQGILSASLECWDYNFDGGRSLVNYNKETPWPS